MVFILLWLCQRNNANCQCDEKITFMTFPPLHPLHVTCRFLLIRVHRETEDYHRGHWAIGVDKPPNWSQPITRGNKYQSDLSSGDTKIFSAAPCCSRHQPLTLENCEFFTQTFERDVSWKVPHKYSLVAPFTHNCGQFRVTSWGNCCITVLPLLHLWETKSILQKINK